MQLFFLISIQQKRPKKIMGALSKLDQFVLSSQFLVQSGSIQGTSQKPNEENHEPDENPFHKDPHPEMGRTGNGFPHTVISEPTTVLHS